MDYSKLPASALSSLTDKDKQIIKSNPGKTLDELAEAGMTKKAEKLLIGLSENVKKVDPEKKLIPKVTSVAPKVLRQSNTQRNLSLGTDAVRYKNNSTGVIVTMDRKMANRLAKAKPHKGTIL